MFHRLKFKKNIKTRVLLGLITIIAISYTVDNIRVLNSNAISGKPSRLSFIRRTVNTPTTIPATIQTVPIPTRGQSGDLWADVIVGQPSFGEGNVKEVVANKVFNPGGVLVDRSVKPNRVYVVDGGNSRILAFNSLGKCAVNNSISCTDDSDCSSGVCNLTTNRLADKVIGQPSFSTGSCNGDANFQTFPQRSPATSSTLCLMPPSQISPREGGASLSISVDSRHNLYIPDWNNNRVLMYKDPLGPLINGGGDTIADAVWGQSDFSGNQCNRSSDGSAINANTICFSNDTSSNPAFTSGIDIDISGNLWVADTLNNRVLRFPFEATSGQPSSTANLVLGSSNFTTLPSGSSAGLNKLKYPGALRLHPISGKLYVLDSYNDDNGDGKLGRVLVFNPSFSNGMSGTRWGDPSKPFDLPTGIEFSLDNSSLWISDYWNHQITQWNNDGTQLQNILYNDHWVSGGNKASLICNSPVGICYQDDTRGSMGLTSRGDLLLSGSSGQQDMVRFKAPIPTPKIGYLTGADFRTFYPPQEMNQISGRSLGGPLGVEVVGNQLIVGDNRRVIFWNNANQLTNNWPVASGVVGSNSLNYEDFTNSYSRIHADKSGHLFVLHNSKVEVFNLPLKGNDVPIKTFGYLFKDLAGNTIDAGKPNADGAFNSGGIYPASDGSYFWLSLRDSSRVIRIRNPLGVDPRVDVVIGQNNSSDFQCNRGGSKSNSTLCLPGAVVMDNQNNLFISDNSLEYHGNNRLLKFNSSKFPANNATTIYAPAADNIWFNNTGPLEPAFGWNNQLVVGFNPYNQLDTNSKKSLLVYNNIDLSGDVSPSGSFNDFFVFPYASDFDEEGNLWVADMNRSRILKFNNPLSRPVFSNLSASFQVNKATFSFDFPQPSQYTVEMAITSDFSSGIYHNFGIGSSSPVVVTDPTWASYQCGAQLWWRVISASGITSPIQSAFIDCPPTLLTPANNSFSPVIPTFDWTDVPNSPYYNIQISLNSDFSVFMDYNATLSSSNFTPGKNFQGATKRYWRVRSIFPNGLSVWSPTYSFTPSFAPYPPRNSLPSNGSVAPTTKPLLTWYGSGSAAGIADYHLQLSTIRDFSSGLIVDSHLGNVTSYQVTTALSPGVNYYWRVKAKDSINQESLWSELSTFTVPVPGAIVNTVTYRVSASADDYNYNCDSSVLSTASSLTIGARPECASQPRYQAYMVFKNVQIPKNSVITDAHLELVSDGSYSNNFTVYQSVSSTGLSSTTEWLINQNWTSGGLVSSANFASAFSSITSYSAWVPGNSVTLLLSYKNNSGTGTRQIKSYDSGSANAAKLVVSYFSLPTTPTPTIQPTPTGNFSSCTVNVVPTITMSNQPVFVIGQMSATTKAGVVTTATGGSITSVKFEPKPYWNSTYVNFDVCSSSIASCPTFSPVHIDTTSPFEANITSQYNHSFGPLLVTATMNTGQTCSTTIMMGGTKSSCFTYKDQNGNMYLDTIPWNLKAGNVYTMTPTYVGGPLSDSTQILWDGGVWDSSNVYRSDLFLQTYPLPVTYKPTVAGYGYSIISSRPTSCKKYTYFSVK